MFFWMVFLKMHQQMLLIVKNAFFVVFSIKKLFFHAFSKMLTDKTGVCVLFLKLKQKKNMRKKIFRFLLQNSKKRLCSVLTPININRNCGAFKTIEAQVFFFSVFLKMRRKKQKWRRNINSSHYMSRNLTAANNADL